MQPSIWGKIKKINEIKVSFLEDQRSWIFVPKNVEFFVSEDGNTFKSIQYLDYGKVEPAEESRIETLVIPLKNIRAHYIKIIAKKLGKLPTWHLGHEHDGRSWLFVDEISIK